MYSEMYRGINARTATSAMYRVLQTTKMDRQSTSGRNTHRQKEKSRTSIDGRTRNVTPFYLTTAKKTVTENSTATQRSTARMKTRTRKPQETKETASYSRASRASLTGKAKCRTYCQSSKNC